MLISLIIPVYNVEQYLRKCLESVEKQNYDSLEVIIVNDGSPDHSQSIIDEFIKRNENFKCYITENHGLGGARNYGLEKAHGEYISFLDSDDYIEPTYISKMVESALLYQSDIICCNNYDVFVAQHKTVKVEAINHPLKTTLKETPQILFNRVSAWGKLYRASLFEGLRYVPREWYEDMRLTPKLFLKANTISYVQDCLLYYVIREGSIMTSGNAKRNLEIINAFDDLIKYFKNEDAYETYKNELHFLVIEHMLTAAITRIALSKDPEKKRIIKQILTFSKSLNLKHNPYLKTMSKNRKLIYFLNTHHLTFLTAFIFKIKNYH